MPTKEKRISVTLTADLHAVLMQLYRRDYQYAGKSYSAMIRDVLYLGLARIADIGGDDNG